MRRTLYFVMALAMVLGFTQCKKEQPQPQSEGVRISLNVTNGNSNGTRANVTPPSVSFVSGDQVLVASGGHYVGTLTHNGTTSFSGDITNPVEGQPLYFYFLGNKQGELVNGADNCTVNISDQTGYPALPVISMGVSIDRSTGETVNYSSGTSIYEAQLHNKCSLMKFNLTTPSSSAICITGMNNTVSVDFATPGGDDNGFSYAMNGIGEIKMKGQEGNGEKTYWAIVLPQASVAIGNAYTEDRAYIGTRPAIESGIGTDQFLNAGFSMTVNTEISSTPLTLEALTDGTIVVYEPQSGMQYTLNGGAKQTMSGNTEINVSLGDKVQFYGNGTSIASYLGTMITGGMADVKVYGNIMSLVDEENFATATTLPGTSYTFYKLFNNYDHLTDASGLLLPATTLASANYCYAEMFSNCDNLVAGPSELPATTLSSRCYQAMFSSCPSLTVAPILPATTLEGYCYFQMFRGCTSLTEAPVLPAPELTGNCYREMFSGCSSLNSITCLATSVINSSNSTFNWVIGVASSGTFTKASGANVSTDAGGSGSTWPRSIRGIPEGWTVIDQ